MNGPRLSSFPGALVISLDFELQWGVRERMRDGDYRASLEGARQAIPRMLDLFAEFDVAATWATVGFLFAGSRHELRRFEPQRRPGYADPSLCPFEDAIGEGEADDPLHFAPSLIDAICRTPRQELATHTFSHYYCQEPGQDAEAFRADLAAASAIASARGVTLTSIVFPRNQHNSAYDAILIEHGITAYRGNPHSWMWRFEGRRESATPAKRLARALDTYVRIGREDTVRWNEVLRPSGLANVRATRLLTPYRPTYRRAEAARLRRICAGIRTAAMRHELYHLWWHPHNFGAHPDENLAFLRHVLEEFDRCRSLWEMRSLSMAEVAGLARAEFRDGTGMGLANSAVTAELSSS